MKALVDLVPVLLFFAAFKLFDIYTATAVAIVTTVLQIIYLKHRDGKVAPMQWVTLGIIVVFGGATLLTHDETFIKWKPTLLYWAFASALGVGQFILKKSPIKVVMGAQLKLPEPVWGQVNFSWMLFFTVLGCLNLWVANHFDTADWVSFKVFGCTALTLVFVVIQALLLAKHMQPTDTTTAENAMHSPPLEIETHAETETAITIERISALLQARLNPTQLEVIDESASHAGHVGANESGSGTHFRVKIASPLFTGLRPVAQHRLVYDAVGSLMTQGLHALAIEVL